MESGSSPELYRHIVNAGMVHLDGVGSVPAIARLPPEVTAASMSALTAQRQVRGIARHKSSVEKVLSPVSQLAKLVS